MAPRTRLAIALVAALVAGAAVIWHFARPNRPGIADWEVSWRGARASLPDRDTLTKADDPRELCEQALGHVRAQEGALFPAPDDVIESAARSWSTAVLDLYTRCHTGSDDHELERAFAGVARIEAEIDALLATRGEKN
jgi:hypothetical protein